MHRFFLPLFLALCLSACQNNTPDQVPTVSRPPDDYRKNNTAPVLATRSGDQAGSSQTGTGEIAGMGWPQNQRDDFIAECVRSAMKKGVSRDRADTYCRCMGENLERLYPDINDLGKLPEGRLEQVMEPFRKSCLGEE